MIPTQKSRRSQWQTLYDVTSGKKKLLLFVEQGASGIGESTVIEPVQRGIIIKQSGLQKKRGSSDVLSALLVLYAISAEIARNGRFLRPL